MRFNPKADSDTGRVRRRGRRRRRRHRRRRDADPDPRRHQGRRRHRRRPDRHPVRGAHASASASAVGRRRHRHAGPGTTRAGWHDTERYDNCKTGADANNDADCARRRVENSLERLLGRRRCPSRPAPTFTPGADRDLQPARVSTGCGQATVAGRPVLLPARPDDLPRHHLLRRRPRGAARRPGRRLRRALRPRPRVRPPHPEPARHDGPGPHPAGRRTPTPYASSCRPTATPACGPRRDRQRRRRHR